MELSKRYQIRIISCFIFWLSNTKIFVAAQPDKRKTTWKQGTVVVRKKDGAGHTGWACNNPWVLRPLLGDAGSRMFIFAKSSEVKRMTWQMINQICPWKIIFVFRLESDQNLNRCCLRLCRLSYADHTTEILSRRSSGCAERIVRRGCRSVALLLHE